MSKSLLVTLLVVASAVAVTSSITACNDVKDGVCKQYCVRGGCSMNCLSAENYHSCEQICTGKI